MSVSNTARGARAMDESVSGDLPSSDNDPYDNTSTSMSGGYKLSITNYHPMPIFGPLNGYNQALLEKSIKRRVDEIQIALHRPPTQEEANARAYWTAKQLTYMSYGGPLGIFAGIYRSTTTRTEFRFPFYKPDLAKFNTKVFPTAGTVILQGHHAELAWHSLRSLLYAALGKSIGALLVGSYAATVSLAGEFSDPRLQDFTKAIRKSAENSVKGTKLGKGNEDQGVNGMTRGGRIQDNAASPTGGLYDDASPTGGMYGQDNANTTSATYGSDSEVSNTSTSTPTSRTPPQPRSQMRQRPVPTQPQIQASEDSSFDMLGEVEGDADSTQPYAQSRPQTQSQGSAWDRLRRGEKPTPRTPPATYKRTLPPPRSDTDSYSISTSDEEKSFAKEEAQKDFDARLERERRGGDFGGDSGKEKKW